MSLELIPQYFPELSAEKLERLEAFMGLFREWNQRINLVSRKDIESLELHHLVHSLALSKWAQFEPGIRILDVGTGGGFPGIPLAIIYPEIQFFLCDSIQKKTKALEEMVRSLKLRNVQVVNKRAEKLESKWNYILGRAVTPIPRFLSWIHDNMRSGGPDGFPYGVLYWKGSLYEEEMASIESPVHAVYPIDSKIPDVYFEGKFIVHLRLKDIRINRLPEISI